MGRPNGILLRGIESEDFINFNIRRDEIVESAALDLHFTLSPSLLPQFSHLKTFLNNELIHSIALDKEALGKAQHLQIDIPGTLFGNHNRLRFQFIGHYADECEVPNHSSLWAEISGSSSLKLHLRKLALHNSLAELPLPFFDERDSNRLSTNFVFAGSPDIHAVEAAAALASWLGSNAQYRGTLFKTWSNELPQDHAIILATNDERPDFLRDLPPVSEATLRIIDHPHNPAYKLLLILGQDSRQLQLAAQALALGEVALHGDTATVKSLTLPQPLRAYEAPRWAPTDRPIKLAELIANPGDLQLKGYALNNAVSTYLQLPPRPVHLERQESTGHAALQLHAQRHFAAWHGHHAGQ